MSLKKILIIVESPAKCKKIQSFLGPNYTCLASYGHIKKLKNVDRTNNFEPIYEVDNTGTNISNLNLLKKTSKASDETIIATDLDREGEAIGFSLLEELKLNRKTTKRITFNQITKSALLESLSKPTILNEDIYQSQQARSILDIIIGFDLSKILINKLKKKGLSAGRCQSVALKILVEKEEEIEKFESNDFFKIEGYFNIENKIISSSLNTKLNSKIETEDFLNNCKKATFKIHKLVKKESYRNPPTPFITSSLQQEASRKYGITPSTCMKIAQKLYESGKITYMRTDSLSISPDILDTIEKFVIDKYGVKYSKKQQYKTKTETAQEAHEAIRPVDINIQNIGGEGGNDSLTQNIYSLIWKRTIASQMTKMTFYNNTIHISISNSDLYFISNITKLIFDGFTILYKQELDEDDIIGENNYIDIDNLKVKQLLDYQEIIGKGDFTSIPARYNEADLISILEKKGIGRPSTWANIAETNLKRNYVEKKSNDGIDKEIDILKLKVNKEILISKEKKKMGSFKNKLVVMPIGKMICQFLNENFNDVINYTFTAQMEKQLDFIYNGKLDWKKMLNDFYNLFSTSILKVSQNKSIIKMEMYKELLGKDEDNYNIIATYSKFGEMVAIEDITKKTNKYIKMAKIPDGIDIKTITKEKALELLKYPYSIGKYKNKNIDINNGMYGLYAKYDSKNYNLKEIEEKDITIDNIIKIISESNEKQESNILREFNENIKILNGKFGAYIATIKNGKKKNIPFKDIDNIDQLKLEDIQKIIDDYVPKKKFNYKKK
jgi:DNA topoisomerase-1